MNRQTNTAPIQAPEIRRYEGRVGKPLEYVQLDLPSGVAYIAQRSGGRFFTYRKEPGRRGGIRTLGEISWKDANGRAFWAFADYLTRDAAEAAILELARAEIAEGRTCS